MHAKKLPSSLIQPRCRNLLDVGTALCGSWASTRLCESSSEDFTWLGVPAVGSICVEFWLSRKISRGSVSSCYSRYCEIPTPRGSVARKTGENCHPAGGFCLQPSGIWILSRQRSRVPHSASYVQSDLAALQCHNTRTAAIWGRHSRPKTRWYASLSGQEFICGTTNTRIYIRLLWPSDSRGIFWSIWNAFSTWNRYTLCRINSRTSWAYAIWVMTVFYFLLAFY